jgi:hypothetical protein
LKAEGSNAGEEEEMWTECRVDWLVVEKTKSTVEIQAKEEIEAGMTQHREDFHVIELTITTDPSLGIEVSC